MNELEQITEPVANHGEGPVWSSAWGGLRYVDMLAGDVHCVDLDSGNVAAIRISRVVAAIRPRDDGGMVAAIERGFALVDADGSVRELPELWADDTVRMNEGGCDPHGRFYCGSMAYDMRPGAGKLYRLDKDGVTVVLSGVTVSNGLAWTPDRAAAYYVDSATQRIDAFSYDGERLSDQRPFARIEEGAGLPDGIAVDVEGGVWVALWRGGQVRRYRVDGKLDAVIALPVTQVTACTFGGPLLDELYITTSRDGMNADEQPMAGAVFRLRPGICGLPAASYCG